MGPQYQITRMLIFIYFTCFMYLQTHVVLISGVCVHVINKQDLSSCYSDEFHVVNTLVKFPVQSEHSECEQDNSFM